MRCRVPRLGAQTRRNDGSELTAEVAFMGSALQGWEAERLAAPRLNETVGTHA
jgi:hypothetical protein